MARGAVVKRGSTWSYVIDLAPDPASGKRRQRWKGGFRTRKEAEAALRSFAVAADEGRVVERSKRTVAEYLREWLAALRPRVRPTTLASYAIAIDRIVREIGQVPLQALTPMHVETLYADLSAHGGRDGRALSPKTVRNCHIVLRKALADAERLGLVVRNVAAVARPPAVRRVEQQTWSASELRRFLALLSGERLEAAFVLLATTGMRRGELLGLRWTDVDLPSRRISVVQALVTVHNELLLTAPKTAKSRRRIALDQFTVTRLRDHKRRQAEERLAAGELWDATADLVFTDEAGGPLHPDSFSRTFNRLARSAGLPRIRLHDLRHGYATLALQAGVHPKVVSERLGHATVGITLDLYSHVVEGLDAEAADTVAAQLFGVRT
jgi:integrase